jgi:phosphatidylglycerol:prolipoprotein diacylglycerol transferase
MFPHLFESGDAYLPSYGVLFAAGVVLAWWWFSRNARSIGVPDHHVFNLAFYALLGGILGAKVLLVIVDWRFYASNPAEILGPFPLAGLLAGLGLGALYGLYLVRRSGDVPGRPLTRVVVWCLVGGVVGSKLQLIVPAVTARLGGAAAPGLIGIEPWFGSLLRSAGVLIGGVIGGAAIFVGYARRHGLPTLRLTDAIVAPLALSQAIGRLGCFAAGCCYGKATDAWWGIVFTDPDSTRHTGVPLNEPLVPTQLIQFGNDLLLALVLTLLWRRKPEPAGSVLGWYVLLYGVSRTVIEFWRGDTARGLYLNGAVSTSQILSVAAALLAVVLLVRGRARARSTIGA